MLNSLTTSIKVQARQLAVEPGVRLLRRYPGPLLPSLEQARRSALPDHVHRTAPLGTWVLINADWFKYDKAVKYLIKDREALLAFYAFPAEHWKHLRTTNTIESTFATVAPPNRTIEGMPLKPNGARHDLHAHPDDREKLATPRWP
jgi:hypothetical protein